MYSFQNRIYLLSDALKKNIVEPNIELLLFENLTELKYKLSTI